MIKWAVESPKARTWPTVCAETTTALVTADINNICVYTHLRTRRLSLAATWTRKVTDRQFVYSEHLVTLAKRRTA